MSNLQQNRQNVHAALVASLLDAAEANTHLEVLKAVCFHYFSSEDFAELNAEEREKVVFIYAQWEKLLQKLAFPQYVENNERSFFSAVVSLPH